MVAHVLGLDIKLGMSGGNPITGLRKYVIPQPDWTGRFSSESLNRSHKRIVVRSDFDDRNDDLGVGFARRVGAVTTN